MAKSTLKIDAVNVKDTNTGGGIGLYSGSNPFNTLNFKSLVAAGNISITTGATTVTISGSSSGGGNDGVVSGGTLNGSAQLVLERTESLSNVNIDLSALSGATDIYVSGATLNGATLELSRSEGQSDVTVDLSALSGTTDTYVSGATLNGTTLELGRTEGLGDVTVDLASINTGQTNTASNLGAAEGIFESKVGDNLRFKSIGVTGSLSISSSGTEITISGGSGGGGNDGVVSGATLNGSTLELGRTEGLGDVTVDLLALSGATPAGVNTQLQYNDSGSFGANTDLLFDDLNCAFTIGTRSGTVGTRSFSTGQGNCASGQFSTAMGFQACATGFIAQANGANTIASGTRGFTIGNFTMATGDTSFAGGFGTSSRCVIAGGCGGFNHSSNSASATSGDGARAHFSAILGGQDHNIAVGNTGATIIGGTCINLTGASYVDTTAVGNLAIMTAPSAGGSNDLLTWESGGTGSGTVRKVTQASISDGRLKTNLKPIVNALDGLLLLNGYEYEFNDKIEPSSLIGKKKYGLIAQDVENMFPLVVSNNLQLSDALYKTVEYRELVPILIEAIKELNDKNDALERKINNLNKK